MTILALLRGGEASDQPFFDPPLLRDRLTEGLAGEPDTLLAQSLALADELESLIARYRSGVDRTLDAYIEASENPGADAANLDARLAVIDGERGEVLREIIRVRRSLVGLLTDAQWRAVFD